MKIRAFSVPCCVKNKQDRQAIEKSLEKDLENLQEILDSNPSHQIQELYDYNKKELEKIENWEMNREIFRQK